LEGLLVPFGRRSLLEFRVVLPRLGINPIVTLEKQLPNMIEIWYKVV
jgi:hypothetical protein